MTAILTAIGHRWEARIAGLVEASGELRLERRCADLAELLSCAEAGLGEVAIVSVDLRGLNLTALDRLHACSLGVVGIAPGDDEAAERMLRQLGIARVLPPEVPAADLDAAITGALADAHADPAPGPAVRLGGPRPEAGPQGDQGLGRDEPTGRGAADRALRGGDTNPIPEPDPQLDPAHDPADPQRHDLRDGAGADPDPDGPPAASPIEPSVDPTILEPREPGVVVAVWGPIGAPGRTSMAINLATELARAGQRVLVVDADTYGASVAQALALLDEAPGLAAAARLAELGTLDLAALARIAPEVESRLRVLTGLPRADRWPEVRVGAAERIVHLGRKLADVVVVDIGFNLEQDEELSYDTLAPRRNAVARSVIESADAVVAVGSADPVGLARLVRGLADLREIGVPAPRVVVNRARSSAVGSGPERRISDSLERFAGVQDVLFVADDPSGFDAAGLTGRALADAAPKSAARAGIVRVADALTADLLVTPAGAGPVTRRSARRSGRGGGARRVTR